jgi:hypothetical protein
VEEPEREGDWETDRVRDGVGEREGDLEEERVTEGLRVRVLQRVKERLTVGLLDCVGVPENVRSPLCVTESDLISDIVRVPLDEVVGYPVALRESVTLGLPEEEVVEVMERELALLLDAVGKALEGDGERDLEGLPVLDRLMVRLRVRDGVTEAVDEGDCVRVELCPHMPRVPFTQG